MRQEQIGEVRKEAEIHRKQAKEISRVPTTSWASHGTKDSSHVTAPLLHAYAAKVSPAHLQQRKSLLLPSVTVLTRSRGLCEGYKCDKQIAD